MLIQEEKTGALATHPQSVCSSDGEIAGTLDASYYKGCGLRQGRERTIVLNDQGGSQMGVSEDISGTLRAQEHGHQPVVYGISAYESNAMKSANPNSGVYEAETSRTLDLNGGSPACNQGGMAVVCIENHPADSRVKVSEDGVVQTLSSRMGTGGGNVPMVMSDVAAGLCAQDGRGGVHSQRLSDPEGNFVIQPVVASKASHFTSGIEGEVADTLYATDYKESQLVAYGLDRASFNQGQNAQYNFSVEEEKVGSLTARGPGGVLPCTSVVRRLTPLECTRLQGFPDGWIDIGEWVDSNGKVRKDADAPKYKALGNSIALPFWKWLAVQIRTQYSDNNKTTMASLFDGIGGFPLSFSEAGIEPIWASEIEDFPIAVTRRRFPDES